MTYKYPQKSIIGMQSTVVGVIFCILSVYSIVNSQYFPAIFFAVLSTPFFLLRKYIDFDPINKTIFTYYYFIGIPLGSKKTIKEIKGIKISKVSRSQIVNSRVSSADFKDSGFGAFLFFDDERVMLKFNDHKKTLAAEMGALCNAHSIKLKV